MVLKLDRIQVFQRIGGLAYFSFLTMKIVLDFKYKKIGLKF